MEKNQARAVQGCIIGAVIVAVVWLAIGLDIHIIRHLEGPAIWLDVFFAMLVTFSVGYHLGPTFYGNQINSEHLGEKEDS